MKKQRKSTHDCVFIMPKTALLADYIVIKSYNLKTAKFSTTSVYLISPFKKCRLR
jgi:hypothetical protein